MIAKIPYSVVSFILYHLVLLYNMFDVFGDKDMFKVNVLYLDFLMFTIPSSLYPVTVSVGESIVMLAIIFLCLDLLIINRKNIQDRVIVSLLLLCFFFIELFTVPWCANSTFIMLCIIFFVLTIVHVQSISFKYNNTGNSRI